MISNIAHSDTYPSNFIKYSNSSFLYIFNIEEYEQESIDEKIKGYKYEWVEVHSQFNGKESYGDIVKALIRYYYSEEDEFEIINDYNAYIFGSEGAEAVDTYKDYIAHRDSIKLQVKKDLGII